MCGYASETAALRLCGKKTKQEENEMMAYLWLVGLRLYAAMRK